MINYEETLYGFIYSSADISRAASDDKEGWVILDIKTPKYTNNCGIQIYVTKTGNVRIFDERGKWTPPLSED